ncbi:hypothetical protein Enr10x_05120 [Gimesia panareensis]|uniref:Tetratricopeptide repeat protein n=1 Tax=Gimesia panareensis TaxID=2527978 RepID=A0A517Q0P7_9PLAN|nr:hypothetical protein [Gimesia panareensis]QDT25217.1 hypothetical protein Enr10x_05120 [Gimesia panareensis]
MTNVFRSRPICLFVLLLLFAGMALARWNRQYFFSPDSARYVIMARSLVNGDGYREIDTPGAPLYSHRPPGLSVLLMPAAWVAPYHVLFAKATVLLTALMMLALLYCYIQRLNQSEEPEELTGDQQQQWSPLLITLLFAINPYTLFYSTLVMSEIPFMACSLGILYLLALRPEQPGKWDLVLMTVLLAFLPFLRTIGIAMVLAVGCWAVVRKSRWPWLVGVACSIAASGLWMLRNASLGKTGYASIALNEIKTQGVIGTLFRMWERTSSHFESFAQQLFPNMPGIRPTYTGMILDEIYHLPGPVWMYLLLAAAVIALSCYGMLYRRHRGGTVALGYLIFSVGVLSLWPWMQGRFTLPLLPVVLAYLPSGGRALKQHIQIARPVTGKILKAAFAVLLVLFGGCLVRTDYQLVHANLQMMLEPDQFYASQLPPSGFCNWTRAGTWLKQNSKPSDRIITRQAAIATTAHRFEMLAFFEIISPEKLHQSIQKFSANYLTSFDREIVSAFPWYLMDQDLVYRFNPVYDERGVMILKVEPNRDGTIRQKYWKPGESLATARDAYEKFPHRSVFQTAYAQELFKNEDYAELIQFIQELQQQQVKDVKLTSLLGWCYYKTKKYSAAIREFERALGMPGQKLLRNDLIRGIELSQKAFEKSVNQDPTKAAESKGKQELQLARTWWQYSQIDKVEAVLNQALESNSLSPETRAAMQTLLAKVYLAKGLPADATGLLEQAGGSEDSEAQTLLKMVQREVKVENFLKNPKKYDVDKTAQKALPLLSDILQLAQEYENFGVPGKALALMERANTSFPKQAKILSLLLKYQLLYALTPAAEETFLQLKEINPQDQGLAEAAQKLEFLKLVPRF